MFVFGGIAINAFSDILENLDWSNLIGLLLPVIPAIICFSIHELSHGYIAYRLGDDTAKREGRITLNPLRHIDPIGFFMLAFMGFGWAKPVSVDMRRFRNPRLGMAITAFAGPLSNIVLTALLMPLYGLFLAVGNTLPEDVYYYANNLISITMYLSVSLAVFNLFPIPPLDGSKVLGAFLPERVYYTIMRYEHFGMIVLFAAVWTDVLSTPLRALTDWVFDNMLPLAQWGFDFAKLIF